MKKIILLFLGVLFIGCQQVEKKNDDVLNRTLIDQTELNNKLVAYTNHMESKNIDGMLSMMTDDATWRFPHGVDITGKENLKATFSAVFSQFKELKMDASDSEPVILAVKTESGDRWLLRWTTYKFVNNMDMEFMVPWHMAVLFDENDMIKTVNSWYDRTDLVKTYTEGDIIK